MPSPESKEPPRRLLVVAQILNALFGAVVGLSGVVGMLTTAATEPLAGKTFEFYQAADELDGQKVPAFWLIQYEVLNPGPGSLRSVELRVDVPHRYDEKNRELSDGMTYREIGPVQTEVRPTSQGRWCQLVISPSVAGQKGALDAGEKFGILLIASVRNENGIRPDAQVYLSGGRHFDANSDRPTQIRDTSKSRLLEWVLVGAGLLWILSSVGLYFVFQRWIQKALVELAERDAVAAWKALESARPESLAQLPPGVAEILEKVRQQSRPPSDQSNHP